MQAQFVALQQAVQSMPPPQTMAGWSDNLSQRLVQVETAQQTHEKTLSGQSDQHQRSVDGLRGHLAVHEAAQTAMRQEISQLQRESLKAQTACHLLKAKLDAAPPSIALQERGGAATSG